MQRTATLSPTLYTLHPAPCTLHPPPDLSGTDVGLVGDVRDQPRQPPRQPYLVQVFEVQVGACFGGCFEYGFVFFMFLASSMDLSFSCFWSWTLVFGVDFGLGLRLLVFGVWIFRWIGKGDVCDHPHQPPRPAHLVQVLKIQVGACFGFILVLFLVSVL